MFRGKAQFIAFIRNHNGVTYAYTRPWPSRLLASKRLRVRYGRRLMRVLLENGSTIHTMKIKHGTRWRNRLLLNDRSGLWAVIGACEVR